MLKQENLRPFLKPPTGIGRGHGRRKSGGKSQAPAQVAGTVPQAKTIAEANQLAVSLGLARHADFTDFDISAANEMIAQIKAIKDLDPNMPELEIIGGIAAVKFGLGGAYRDGTAYGDFVESIAGSHKGQIGIGINSDNFSRWNMTSTLQKLKKDVATTWSPVGCGSVKSIVDHEIGHWIDHKYNISKDSRIRKLFRAYHERNEDYYTLPNGMRVYGSQKMGAALSRYANTNAKEFLAEAWAEYRNNPNPRPVAKEVGDIVMSYIRR